jgi:hypothetical protein
MVQVTLPPVAEQIVDHRVQTVLGRIPRLEQVVVQADLVDRPDGDVGVGICGEHQKLRARRMGVGLREQLDPRHLRHPLIGDDQRHQLVTQRHRRQHRKRLRSRTRPYHTVVGAILP